MKIYFNTFRGAEAEILKCEAKQLARKEPSLSAQDIMDKTISTGSLRAQSVCPSDDTIGRMINRNTFTDVGSISVRVFSEKLRS